MVSKAHHYSRHMLLSVPFIILIYHETFENFGIQYWPNNPPPSSVREFVSKILCAQENDQVFYKKQCVGGRKCEECSHLALFDVKYPIDPNDPQF